jgi:hypothetical protein
MKFEKQIGKPVTVAIFKNGIEFFRNGTLLKIRKAYGRDEGLVHLGGAGQQWFVVSKIKSAQEAGR